MIAQWLRTIKARKYIAQRSAEIKTATPAWEGDDEMVWRGFQTVQVEEMEWARAHAPNWEIKAV